MTVKNFRTQTNEREAKTRERREEKGWREEKGRREGGKERRKEGRREGGKVRPTVFTI